MIYMDQGRWIFEFEIISICMIFEAMGLDEINLRLTKIK